MVQGVVRRGLTNLSLQSTSTKSVKAMDKIR